MNEDQGRQAPEWPLTPAPGHRGDGGCGDLAAEMAAHPGEAVGRARGDAGGGGSVATAPTIKRGKLPPANIPRRKRTACPALGL
jgi:hypothetical protein